MFLFLDPRLAFAKSEKNSTNMNHIFNDYTTSSEILKSRDLTGFNAIVTGANRGIGKFNCLNEIEFPRSQIFSF